MICLICRRAEVVDGYTSVIFERGEMRLIVNTVPAQVCPGCGEAYVEENVAVWLLQKAEEMFVVGELDGVVEYNHPAKFLDSPNSK